MLDRSAVVSAMQNINDWRHPYEIEGMPNKLAKPWFREWHPWRWSVDRPVLEQAVGGLKGKSILDVACNDGWYGLQPSLEEAAREVKRLHELLREAGRAEDDLEVTYGASVESADDVERWQDAGVDRLVVAPWSRSPDAVEALHRFAEAFL